jgi:hypothetical protein
VQVLHHLTELPEFFSSVQVFRQLSELFVEPAAESVRSGGLHHVLGADSGLVARPQDGDETQNENSAGQG